MNREQRRAAKHKRGQKFDRNEAHRDSCMALTPLLSRPYSEKDIASLGVTLRMSWQAIIDGRGTDLDFANVATANNVCAVLAQEYGESDKLMCANAAAALELMRDRKKRLGKLGVCAHTLKAITPMVDFHDWLIKNSTVIEMVEAQITTVLVLNEMEKIECSKT